MHVCIESKKKGGGIFIIENQICIQNNEKIIRILSFPLLAYLFYNTFLCSIFHCPKFKSLSILQMILTVLKLSIMVRNE
jgi:hypothetical protein